MDTETELASLRATVAALSRQVEALTAPAPTAPTTALATDTAPPSEPRSTRRGALRLLGAAAAGGAAALVAGQPAAADNGISLLGSNNTTDSWTRVDFVSTVPGGTAFMFQAGNALSPGTLGGKPAALGGVSTSGLSPTGVQAYSNQPGGVGLHARHANGGTGLLAEANSFGWAINATSVSSFSIVASSQDSTGISANGGLYGALVAGSRAALRLTPSGVSGPPSAALSHNPGELDVDLNGDLWYCSGDFPARWHRLNQPAFYSIAPARVYDSRKPLPAPGALATGSNRLVSVADSRNITTGAVITAGIVPANAVAIAANVTVTNTTGTGYLSINPGGNTTVSASTINWFGSNQTLANGVTLTLNANREITVICGGTGSATHFLIDVTGYFL